MGVGVQVPPPTPNDQGKSPGHWHFHERTKSAEDPFVRDLSAEFLQSLPRLAVSWRSGTCERPIPPAGLTQPAARQSGVWGRSGRDDRAGLCGVRLGPQCGAEPRAPPGIMRSRFVRTVSVARNDLPIETMWSGARVCSEIAGVTPRARPVRLPFPASSPARSCVTATRPRRLCRGRRRRSCEGRPSTCTPRCCTAGRSRCRPGRYRRA